MTFYVDQYGELRRRKPAPKSWRFEIVVMTGVSLAGLAVVGYAFNRSPVTVESSHSHAIPFRALPDGMHVYASLGGVPHDMIVDTGAGMSAVTAPIANALIGRRQAVVVDEVSFTQADGSTRLEPIIAVRTVAIGGYRLHNVRMSVAPDGGGVLLGLAELNAIGSFTIDSSRHQIRFEP
jgi:clan AA aspartic protease (TIGR02281 family)